MRQIILIGIILCCGNLCSQSYFSNTVFDLGEISQINQDVAEINLSNPLEEDIYILRIDADPRISIRYTSKSLVSGSATLLRFKLNPSQQGRLREKAKIYLSSNAQPIEIIFKGIVKTIPKNNKTACPDFSGGRKAQLSYQLFKQQLEGEKNQFFVELVDKEQAPLNQEEINVSNDRQEQQADHIKSRKDKVRKTPEERRNSPSVLEILFGDEREDSTEFLTETSVEIPESSQEEGTVLGDDSNLLSEEFKPNNVIFLIDASTSMKEEERMHILKHAMIQLLEPLRAIDYLSIVTYSGEANVLLPPTAANQKEDIRAVIENIIADGSTHAAKGIKKAIQLGESNFIVEGNNQIILATDGAFELGSRNESLRRKIKKTAQDGLTVSVIGIKNANWTKKSLKEIVELGEGNYLKIDNMKEASKVLEEVKKKSKR